MLDLDNQAAKEKNALPFPLAARLSENGIGFVPSHLAANSREALAAAGTTCISRSTFVSSTSRWASWQVYDGTAVDRLVGLDFFGARYFSGAQGRFTSPDRPFADQQPEDPQSWNLYAYVRNNPLKNTDPNGTACTFSGGLISAFTSCVSDPVLGVVKEAANQTLVPLSNLVNGVVDPAIAFTGFQFGQSSGFAPANSDQASGMEVLQQTEIFVGLGGANPAAAASSLTDTAGSLANSGRNFAVQSEAQGVHDALGVGSIAFENRTTAVARAVTNDGTTVRMVASSEPTLTTAQRAAMPNGAIPVTGARGVHAEQKILDAAKRMNARVTNMGTAPRNPCATEGHQCQEALTNSTVSNDRPFPR